MLWQSSLLIAILFAFELLFRRKLRASIRYALWLVVLVKLCVPPTLALPTSPAWWLHATPPPAAKLTLPHYTVTYDNGPLPETSPDPLPVFTPPPPALSPAAWLLAASLLFSSVLLLWLLVRWWQLAHQVRQAADSERLTHLAAAVQPSVGLRSKVQVKVTTNPMSPAVCGLFRPAILIPRALAEKFSDEQLRAVLLHELIHLRRRDVWLNFLQALLQIFYWWHPLVWLANARIRRVREEAVDDAVMLALRDGAEAYAPTLLEVARFALNRPRVSLGLVGILESRQSLRRRIERLVDFHPPRHAGLTLASLLGILAFTAIAVPMGQGPESPKASIAVGELQTLTVKVNPNVFIKNMKVQAGRTLRAPTDSPKDMLTDILRGEAVDCDPPHGPTFNAQTGEITIQNTPESLVIVRRVIGELNRADGKCVLPLRDLSVRLKMVLISAEFYSIPNADFRKMISKSDSVNFKVGNSLVGAVDTGHLAAFREGIKSLGLKPFQRPRVQTSNGRPAQFFVGDVTNGVEFKGVEFDCCPLVGDGHINLAFRMDVTTGLGADGTIATGRVTAEDRGGIIVCANNPDGPIQTNLVFVISVQILTNNSPTATGRKSENIGDSTNVSSTNPDDKKIEAGKLVQDARLLYEMGKLDEAKNRLKSALALDPENAATKYYLAQADTGVSLAATRPSTVKNPPAATTFFTRTYKVDTRKFISQLHQLPGMDGGTNPPDAVSEAAQKYFSGRGVDLESPPGKTVFSNQQNGMLLVRATAADLDVIDKAVQALNYTAPQIHIRARFLEVPKDLSNSLKPFPTTTNGMVIVTADSARKLLEKIRSESTKTLAEPELVTTSGRQTQVRATQVITMISGVSFEMQYDDLNLTSNKNNMAFETHPLETGPVLDSVTTVLADGYTIDLKTTACLTEFFGYTPSKGFKAASLQDADSVSLPVVHPSLRHQESNAHVKL